MIEEFDKSGNWLFRWRSFLPVILYILATLVVLTGLDGHADHTDMTWIFICLAVSLFGQVIRGITIGFTPRGTSGRNTKAGQVAEELNTLGIYSVCRHPLYLGNFFMWLGIMMYVGNWWFTAICVLLFWVYYERIMFAEEFFLRGKFGASYRLWADKTAAFWPNIFKWKSSNVSFSAKNVMMREYNGFFLIFLSLAYLDVLKNYLLYKSFALEDLITPFWLYALIGSFIVFIILRSLKKYTRVLHVEGR